MMPNSIDSAIVLRNMFGKIKGWRRIHIHYDRCTYTFMSAI